MKYRIIETKRGDYNVAYKYKYWPFWFKVYRFACGLIDVVASFNSIDEAENHIKEMINKTNKTSKVVREYLCDDT